MIESACRLDRQGSDQQSFDRETGQAATRCVVQQLDALKSSGGRPDLSATSTGEQQMMESACRPDRQVGPAAYYRCLRQQVDALRTSPGSPDLSATSGAERKRMESACRLDREMNGPAAYYRCLRQKIEPSSAAGNASHLPSKSQATSGKKNGSPHGSAAKTAAGNRPAESSAQPQASSSYGRLAAWLAGILALGFLAKVAFDRIHPKKCRLCGQSTENRGAYCATCDAAAQEAERYAREQREIEETRRVTVLAELHRLSEPQFKDLIASLFKKEGYTVRRRGGNGNDGIDLVLQAGQEKEVVECKRSKTDIETPTVREFYGALMHAAARHGFIVTTASFSQGARDFARGKPISLISAAEILQWMDGTYSSRDQRAVVPATSGDSRAFDPYAVLGVSPTASLEEIRAAYRREMVNYHPDKVAHLGKDLQEFAKAKAQQINRAFEELSHSA
jgi:restriction system protein